MWKYRIRFATNTIEVNPAASFKSLEQDPDSYIPSLYHPPETLFRDTDIVFRDANNVFRDANIAIEIGLSRFELRAVNARLPSITPNIYIKNDKGLSSPVQYFRIEYAMYVGR